MTQVLSRWTTSLLIAISLNSIALAQNDLDLSVHIPDLGNPVNSRLNPQQEKEFGRQIFREKRHSKRIIEDPELSEWIQELGAKLARHAPNRYGQFLFAIANNASINAYASVGGVIVINSGLILDTSSVSQLASVVAHEIAHVDQRHITRMLAENRHAPIVTGLGLLAGAATARHNPEAAQAIIAGTMASNIQQQLSYNRQAEAEADRIGLRILAAAGFDPQGMPEFMEKMDRRHNNLLGDISTYLRSHPLDIDRLSDTRYRARQLGRRNPHDEKDYLYAKEKLRVITQQDTSHYATPAVRNYAMAHKMLNWGRYQDALPLAQKTGNSFAEQLLKAKVMTHNNQVKQAQVLLQNLQKRAPRNSAVAIAMAETFEQQGNYRHAWQALARIPNTEALNLVYFEKKQSIAQKAGMPFEAQLAHAERSIHLGQYIAARTLLEQLIKRPSPPHIIRKANNHLANILRYEKIKKRLDRF